MTDAPNGTCAYPNAVFALVLCTCFGFPAPITADQDTGPSQSVTAEDIVNVWEAREETITSASFTWQIERTGFNRWSTYQAEYWCAEQPTDLSDGSTNNLQSLSLQDDKVRGEMSRWRPQDYQEFAGFSSDSTGPGAVTRNAYLSAWKAHFRHLEAQKHAPYRYMWIFDGRERFDIHEGHTGAAVAFKLPGRVNNQGEYPYLNDVLCKPIMLACRPLRWPGSAISIEDLQLTDNSAVQGRPCTVVEYAIGHDSSARMWVDTGRDCHILRLIYREEGKAKYQLDIEYQPSEAVGWIPQRWSVVPLNDSRHTPGRSDTIQFASCRVTGCSVNKGLPDDLFRVRLAPGTYMVDVAANRKYRVTSDEETRPLNAEEFVLVHSALETANPDVNEEPYIRWYQAIAILILLVVGASLYWRRWRSARLRNPLESRPQNLDGASE